MAAMSELREGKVWHLHRWQGWQIQGSAHDVGFGNSVIQSLRQREWECWQSGDLSLLIDVINGPGSQEGSSDRNQGNCWRNDHSVSQKTY